MDAGHAPLAWVLVHVVIGFAGTWLARIYAVRRNLLDQPGDRRSHVVATPRGGGISIVASMVLAFAFLAWMAPSVAWPILSIGVGMLLVAAIGWIDDHRPLSPWSRLCVHALAAGLLAWATHVSGGDAMDVVLAFAMALVLVNVWNFMDGIDGLAASQAAIVAGGYAWLSTGAASWLALALLAAICGFLPHNFPKARIFLGDVGSGTLGYVLAALMVAAAMADGGGIGAWALVMLPVSVFLIDASLTLGMRILRREAWWTPHVQHAYQRWARQAGSHPRVTSAYALATSGTLLAMVCVHSSPATHRIAMLGAIWLAGGVGWCWLQRRLIHNP